MPACYLMVRDLLVMWAAESASVSLASHGVTTNVAYSGEQTPIGRLEFCRSSRTPLTVQPDVGCLSRGCQ